MRSLIRRAIVVVVVLTTATVASSAALADTDFYEPPDPLPKGKPGTIVRSERIDAPPGARAWRVLYTSHAADGRDIAVSGVIIAPEGKPPRGGRPVVAWAHGTTGIADQCAPSRRADVATWIPYATDLLAAGYVIAATDYEGLGTPGTHPYLVGPSEGTGVLDSARAARRLDAAGAGRDIVVWGHSQGGHAALFAGEMAREYASELRLDGVVAGAPAAAADQIVLGAARAPRGAGFYVLAAKGFAAAFPDELSEDELITTDARDAAARADTECAQAVVPALADLATPVAPDDVADDEAFVELLRASAAGNRIAGAPVLVVQGSADTLVLEPLTDRFVEKACGSGSVVDYRVYDGAGHGDVLGPAKQDTLDWIAARFAGDAARQTCPTG